MEQELCGRDRGLSPEGDPMDAAEVEQADAELDLTDIDEKFWATVRREAEMAQRLERQLSARNDSSLSR